MGSRTSRIGLTVALMLSLLSAIGLLGQTKTEDRCVGGRRRFSANSTLVKAQQATPDTVKSPDGNSSIAFAVGYVVEGDSDLATLAYGVAVDIHGKTARRTLIPPLELLWSPDSTRLAVTHFKEYPKNSLIVFSFRDGRLRVIDLTKKVRRLLGNVNCAVDFVTPDVAAVKWIDASQLMVVAHVRPDEWCDNCDLFKVAVFSIDQGKFTAVYDQLEAKRRFGDDLGCTLSQASDQCALQPGSCRANFKKPFVEGAAGCCPVCRPYSLNPKANPATTVDCPDKPSVRPK